MPSLRDLIGYSPDRMEDEVRAAGGVMPLMAAVQSARYREPSADPDLLAMTPEDRAALDRYTNFAQMKAQGGGPLDYVGGMANMALTEGLKMVPGADKAASAAWNTLKGTPGQASFFGGADQSAPSLANLLAAHYGYMREEPQAPVRPGFGLQGAQIQPDQGGVSLGRLLAAVGLR